MYQLKDQKPGAELKSSAVTLTVVRLLSTNLEDIERDLREKIATGPKFFANAPVVLDVEEVRDSQPDLEFAALVSLLRELGLVPVGVRHATPTQQQAAAQAGMAIVQGGIRDLPSAPETVDRAQVKEVESKAAKRAEPPPRAPQVNESEGTASDTALGAKTVHRQVRSGQQIYAQGRDLVVLGGVNGGAEVVADGDIHVYGYLRGRALAGANGDRSARIYCQNMGAELVAIAGRYQILDDSVPSEVRGRATQVSLDGEDLRFELLG